MNFKYIIERKTYPTLFSPERSHDRMGRKEEITSAAFVKIVNGKVVTFGESSSLNLKPNPDDAEIISMYLGL